MKSMTGFGKATQSLKKVNYHVEIRSINSRFIELSFYNPSKKPELEHKTAELLKKAVHRGKIEVSFKVEPANRARQNSFNVNELKAKFEELEEVRKTLKIKEPVTLQLLAELNRTWFFKEKEEFQVDQQDLLKVIQLAIEDLVRDRLREGEHLKKVLTKRLKAISKSVKLIHSKASKSAGLRFEKLKERVTQLLESSSGKPSARVEVELAQMADKSDVTEELDRLHSHLKHMENLFESQEPIGRQLDFLLQEINREMNTIGSKSQDTFMTNEVISVKTELEKIREQIQNLE